MRRLTATYAPPEHVEFGGTAWAMKQVVPAWLLTILFWFDVLLVASIAGRLALLLGEALGRILFTLE